MYHTIDIPYWNKVLHHTGHVVTSKNAWVAKQVSLVHVTVITSIGLFTLIHIVHSVRNNIGVLLK